MISRLLLAVTLLLAGAMPSAAEDALKPIAIGDDSYLAGRDVFFDRPGKDDLFAAGEIVRAQADISGSAHIAGRKIKMLGAVGRDAYLAGMDVALDGPVTGDATLAGYSVTVAGVGGNLRISGGDVVIRGPVAGYALVAGNSVRIEGRIAGDAYITAGNLTFADGARIDGRLILFEDDREAQEIPANVVPPDRIERRDISQRDDAADELGASDWTSVLGSFLAGVVIIGGLAALFAAAMPQTLAELRESLLQRPFRNLLYGFLTQSVFLGAAIVLVLTIIGIVASPAAVLAALVAGFAGYVVGVYAFGVGLLILVGQPLPTEFWTRALAAGVGAVAAGLIALIPYLGWLFIMLLMLAGVGAITLKIFRPAFFVAD